MRIQAQEANENKGSNLDLTGTNRPFVYRLVAHHRRKVPQPILPVNYSFFLAIALPKMDDLPLAAQLNVAKAALARRRAYPCNGPFNCLVAFELQLSPNVSIYLNPDGDFAK